MFLKKRIITTELNDVSLNDKIFLLNVDDAKKYFLSDSDRQVKDDEFYQNYFLRTKVHNYGYNLYMAYINCDGEICNNSSSYEGALRCSNVSSIRPGMWVRL